ncbi:MAG: ABC transporter ATP-binding protein [Bacteroidota bacterium]
MKNAIEIAGLGKRYRRKALGSSRYRTLRESLSSIWQVKSQQEESDYFWALKDVDLTIERGDVVGIIGPNGAGKSTLLKLLSRVTAPTEGHFSLHGRVASLLEVGTGFHPELTGRENIYLSGAIMGMRRQEIKKSFDEIVAFSGVEDFLDLPVKRYSSGMYVRLGFAVAAHLRAEIMLVDEVLAVGDAAFQKKCLGKIGDVAKSGRTVLFVSHNLGAVREVCEKGVAFVDGQSLGVQNTRDAIDSYLSQLEHSVPKKEFERKKGVDKVKIVDLLINKKSVWSGKIVVEDDKEICINSLVELKDNRPVQINIGIYKNGVRLFTLQDTPTPQAIAAGKTTISSIFTIPKGLLRMGKFTLGIGGNINGVGGDWFWSAAFCQFEVINGYHSIPNELNFGLININTTSYRI